jgi:hypothetical protein
MLYNKIGGSKVYTQNDRCEQARIKAFQSDLFRGLEQAIHKLTNWEVRDERKNQKVKNLRFSDHREQASLSKALDVESKQTTSEPIRRAFIDRLALDVINELVTAVIINQGYWRNIKDREARETIRDMRNYTLFIETLRISIIPHALCDYKRFVVSSSHIFTINLYVTLSTNLSTLVESLAEQEEDEEELEEINPEIKPPGNFEGSTESEDTE